jgi:hypothetical protein
MKTKFYTIVAFFAIMIMANRLSAQAVAEGTEASNQATTEMDMKAAIPTLSNFLADVLEDGVQIKWVVKNEPQNSIYYIERSFDGENYDVIGTVEAKNNNSNVNEYSFTDKEISDKDVYYSVRQESKKGTLYSKLLSVEKIKTIK